MKKFIPFLVVIAMVATMIVFSVEAQADWILYDNFNSGYIDPNRWTIDASSAFISIKNGKAKFEHVQGYPNDSAWLGIKKNPETVKGIKARVTVASCTGDVQARIGGFIGKWDDSYVFDELTLQGSIASPRIYGNLAAIGDPPNYPFVHNLFYGEFIRPVEILYHTFTLTMTFSDEEVEYKVSGLGEIEHELPEDLSPTDIHFKGIGTRSPLGNGPCVVYFDDVYIYR
jgi:hypothetical protein